MNLEPIADLLQSANVGKKERDIFLNMIPISAPSGILLRNPLQGTRIDYEMKGYINTEFQVIVRAGSYPVGEQLMKRVYQALTIENQRIGTLHITRCYPGFEPVVYPLSDGNLLEFSAEFKIVCSELI